MELVSILYFFIVTVGLGYTLKRILNLEEFEDDIEKIIFLIGLGLSFFIFLSIPLSFLSGLYWYIFLIIALALPIYDIFKKIKQKEKFISPVPKKRFKKYIILGLITLLFFLGYLIGAFNCHYLEDTDSWEHAAAAKYIFITHTYVQPNHLPLHYLEPYPPFYSTLMGILHQIHPESIQWILKFFNVLLISLGLPFAYIWLKKFTASEGISLIGVFLLTVLPSFMSRFIWAQSLSLILWFPALYSIEKIKEEEDKKWVWAASLIIASILITQPFSGVVFGIFYFFYLLIEFVSQLFKSNLSGNINNILKAKYLFITGFLGLIFALSLYWVPEIIFRGWETTGNHIGSTLKGMFIGGTGTDTSAGIVYGIKDFLIASVWTKIDQPTGLGLFIFGLLIFSIIILISQRKKIFSGRNRFLLISLAWLIISTLGIQGNAFPYKLFPHRFWVFFSIPVAILVAFGIIWLYDFTKRSKSICYSVLIALFVGIVLTSGFPKYFVEVFIKWPPGPNWASDEQFIGYLNLKDLPPNTLIYSLCKNPVTVIGMDKMDYPWIKEVEEYKNYALLDTLDDNYNFLKKYNYSYLIVDIICVKNFGDSQTAKKLQGIGNSQYFEYVPQLSNNSFFLFKIL